MHSSQHLYLDLHAPLPARADMALPCALNNVCRVEQWLRTPLPVTKRRQKTAHAECQVQRH